MPEVKSGRAAVLARVPIFSDLSDGELKFLSDRAVNKHYSAGELIFSEGDACSGLYIVESGEVRIFKTSSAGREQVLTVEVAGSAGLLSSRRSLIANVRSRTHRFESIHNQGR